jgi:N-acetylglucosamine kinase-like BadF-type ATPase
MRLLIGVDAGASHTEAAVATSPDRILARQRGAPGSVRAGMEAEASAAIVEAVHAALAQVDTEWESAVLVVGAAGAGRASERQALERTVAGTLGLDAQIRVTTDGEIALESVFPGRPGLVVLAGSGSIGYARDTGGTLWRVGGLGWRIGDEGSGYALARDALAAVGRAADGRGKPTALEARLCEAAGVTDTDSLARWALAASPKGIAGLARVVCDVGQQGDEVARALIEQAAANLCLHVEALLNRVPGVAGLPLVLGGGLLSEGSPVRATLVDLVRRRWPQLHVVPGPLDPVVGALRLADRLPSANRKAAGAP